MISTIPLHIVRVQFGVVHATMCRKYYFHTAGVEGTNFAVEDIKPD